MKKYKIDNYIVKADSIRDAVTIVKTINNSVKDKRVFGFGNFPYEYWLKNNDGGWFLAAFSKKKYDRSEIEALRKKYMLKNGKLPDYQEKIVDSVKDARRINYDDDIIEVKLNGKVVFRGYAEDWLDDNFDSNFKWTGSQYEASNAKGKWVVRVIDSFQKDSLTVRDVIQSLINEETSAISSYNVALETLRDHIPAEAYEAIKAIRDDEQRHVENLHAVLNGNVTPKNLEN